MSKLYTLKIRKKIQETADSVSLVFEIPEELKDVFQYKPAQFLTFQFQMKEKKYLRSYSISSCPLLNEDFKTTIKRIKKGEISNYIVTYSHVGDEMHCRKPAGKFFKPPSDLKPKNYCLFAGGSGITPLFSILKTVLLSDPENKVFLFYANRNENSIIYNQDLKDWQARHPERLHIWHIFSQPEKKESQTTRQVIKGRLNKDHLNRYFDPSKDSASNLYYLCGPIGFMQTVKEFLIEKKVQKSQIRIENFLPAKKTEDTSYQKTSSVMTPSNEEEGELTMIGQQGKGEQIEKKTIKAHIDDEMIEIPAQNNIPILEQLLSAGYTPPFSCLSGSCMSCLATLKKGEIFQNERGILEDENIENHEILTCQAIPKSQLVEVDYQDE